MALHDVRIPLYCSSGEDKKHKLFVDEFAGRLNLTIQKGGIEILIECYFDDLERAWNAVRR